MCGIVGMAGNLSYRDKDFLKMMMIFCQIRGEDSTGIFYVKQGEADPYSHKVLGDPSNMFETTFWDKLNLFDKNIVVAHCRKATIGVVSKYTAHPFTTDHITGVHNGTLRNWKALPGDTLATDSMTLFKNFAREGGVRETLEQTDGAYALVFYDAETGHLNFIRNKERPLYYAFSEKGDVIYWASEAWMIYMTAAKLGVKLMNLTPKDKYPSTTLEVDEDQWWRVTCNNRMKDALVFQAPEELVGGVRKAVAPAPFVHRTPFSWEGESNDQGSGFHRPYNPNRTPPAPIQNRAGSTTTSGSSHASLLTHQASQQKDGHSQRPTLSLVANSKSDGSGSSNSGNPPASPSDPLNDPVPLLGHNIEGAFDNELKGNGGLVLTKDEFRTLVDNKCIWCKVPHSFEELKGDAKNPSKLGEWIDDDSFLCTGCQVDAQKQGIC